MVCTDKTNVNAATESISNSRRAEERYHCSLCPRSYDRSKNLNRHVKTFHERETTWSCAAFTNHDVAFERSATESSSTSDGTTVITCIFCDKKFSGLTTPGKLGNHLRYAHRFGECNPDREFFRFDHVQQHLKHYHCAQLPQWTQPLRDAFLLHQTKNPAQAAASPAEGSFEQGAWAWLDSTHEHVAWL